MTAGGAPPRPLSDRVALFFATGFGSGLAKFAPGTWGSLAACGVVWAFSTTGLPANWTLAALAVAATLGCIVTAGPAERILGTKDPQCVVLDEFAGLFIALLRLSERWPTFAESVVAFLLFRLFDIIKPTPARQLQRVKGGLGVVLDDVIAGIYALIGTAVYRDYLSTPSG